MDSGTYEKRAGTSSGIEGYLYETKLISLINFRLLHNDRVDQFSLTCNRNDAGAFDDICFKAKIKIPEQKKKENPRDDSKNYPKEDSKEDPKEESKKDLNEDSKEVTVFIQAKHKNNRSLMCTSDIDWVKYFESYLKIRRTFNPNSKDIIFGGKFDETECVFVIYTSAKGDSSNKIYKGSFADFFNKLLGTGGSCTQLSSYTDENLDFLCKKVIEKRIVSLVEQLVTFICSKPDSSRWMSNEHILCYHVILAQHILHVSEIQPEGHRIASFRQDFFTTHEEFLVLFKNTLCLEVIKKRKSEEMDVQGLLLQFLDEPSEVTTLSKLIGSVFTYKNSKLEFVNKSTTDNLKRQLDKANVSQSAVYEAAELAAKDYLLSLKLKVPASFGNKDLTIGGNPETIEKRLNYLTLKIKELLKKSNPNYIVAIDETLGKDILKLNGGIASAVGNLLVFDKSSKLLKFTDNFESLGRLARRCYESLKSEIENLHEYKLAVKLINFPKLSFERDEYEVSLVRDFYDKLLFYTNQADQNGVEKILTEEIKDHPCSDVNNFRVRSNVIFLKYHDEIQKLWMTPKVGQYLTKESKIYENAVTAAMSESLMGVLNIMHKIKKKNYTFNEDAFKSFVLHGQIIGTVIATESCELTVAKVEQYLENKDRVVLDLELISKLPFKSYSPLCEELTNTTKEKILIIVCNNIQGFRNSGRELESIVKAVDGKQIIIITNKISVDIMTEYFSQASHILNDERSVFTDLSVESQKKFLATSKIRLQGKDVSLHNIIKDTEFVYFIDEYVFNKLINNETIKIGGTDIYNNYEKQFYIDRRVSRTKTQEHGMFDDVKAKVLETFYDLKDNVVLLTGELGMGKSTLLTHLTLKTKELHPEVWILRINLSEHERMVRILKENILNSSDDTFSYLCQVALGEEYDEGQKNEWGNEGELIKVEDPETGKYLSMKCSGSKSKEFQLKMFLRFYYNAGKMIFLFDGLDEINIASKWQLDRVVSSLQLLVLTISRKHKVWITSRSLNIIEEKFGPSYKLENFSPLEQDTYLKTFWKYKIQKKNIFFKKLNEYCVADLHYFLTCNETKYFRGYVLFLDFLKMASPSSGVDFPYDKYYNEFITSVGLCDSKIPCFPDDTMPWDLNALAQRFKDKFEIIETAILYKMLGELVELMSRLNQMFRVPNSAEVMSRFNQILSVPNGVDVMSRLNRDLNDADVMFRFNEIVKDLTDTDVMSRFNQMPRYLNGTDVMSRIDQILRDCNDLKSNINQFRKFS